MEALKIVFAARPKFHKGREYEKEVITSPDTTVTPKYS